MRTVESTEFLLERPFRCSSVVRSYASSDGAAIVRQTLTLQRSVELDAPLIHYYLVGIALAMAPLNVSVWTLLWITELLPHVRAAPAHRRLRSLDRALFSFRRRRRWKFGYVFDNDGNAIEVDECVWHSACDDEDDDDNDRNFNRHESTHRKCTIV